MKKKSALTILLSLTLFIFSIDCFAETAPLDLSLDDAILLSLRNNPSVQSVRLSYVLQKYSLYIQQWQFYPHYSLQASASYGTSIVDDHEQSPSKSFSISPGVSLLTPIGTQITLSGTDQQIGGIHPGATVSVVQPLLRGFGRPIVEQALENAKDDEYTARLGVEGTLRSTVTTVINSYLDVVSAERTVIIDEDALKRAQISVEQTKKFIKAGHKAGNELVTVEANVATAQSNLANDKNHLQQARYQLLAAIGLDPESDVKFTSLNLEQLIDKYNFPTLDSTKDLTLHNDIQYQTDQILLHGSKKRALMVAEDNLRWQLNLTANASTGNSVVVNNTNLNNSVGFNSLFTGLNSSRNVAVNLTIPIDDQVAKESAESAKIALQQAEIALQKERWDKETGAINGWNLVLSAKRSLQFAESAAQLQQKTYDINYQKYLHGLIDSLQLQSAQSSLIQSQQALLSARIGYIKALVSLDALTGHTLKTWNIPVRLT